MKYLNSTTNMISHLRNAHNFEVYTLPSKGGKTKRCFESTKSGKSVANGEDDDPDAPSPSTHPESTSTIEKEQEVSI